MHPVDLMQCDHRKMGYNVPSLTSFVCPLLQVKMSSSSPPGSVALTTLIDGSTAYNPYVGFGPLGDKCTEREWVQVDLGSVQYVDSVKVWMYWADGR